MILRFLITIAVLVTAVLVYAAVKPSTFRIQRSVTIQAPPEKVFALINDLHNWPRWAPQDREDPIMKRTFSGPESGLGAESGWIGSGSTGKGQMSIIESATPSRIVVQVDWVKPFAARNINEFALEPIAAGTKVTWSMHGPNLYVMKLMSVFVNMDRMMGKHFENGLDNLKAIAER